ncbi:LPXTG cell wall anchor domain-containing protein [Streptococcus oralis]|uniref:LPXTG cell wall anchor domain-containing protein n=1 Tax=Streptococcus oralis subsp. oralis TaxID=1891914 RepID=A0A7H9FJA8_STROR|nr:LPXTG cell wall anchor domain-containing protein [Streptococcus oralis]QLL98073.1 LPXTG cell wall anchor domain-containing protein [Streptococcus oralis subsp. oralis]
MNKKQVLATLALSTIALAQAGYVSADELAPIDSSAPATEVVTPTAPSASTETEAPAVQPTEPSVTPVDPIAPSAPQDKDNAESLDGVPADKPATPDQPAPSDKPQGKDNAESLDGVPADKPATPDQPAPSDKPQGKDNAESLDGVPAEKPKTTDEANEQGKSQIGTTSTSTGQVVHDVTKEPVETNTGASIVSTQNGNVVLSDGSVVAPEEVGGTVNEDKTISVTDSEGKLKTLPNTGAAESILGAIGALLLTAVGYFYKKKMF